MTRMILALVLVICAGGLVTSLKADHVQLTCAPGRYDGFASAFIDHSPLDSLGRAHLPDRPAVWKDDRRNEHIAQRQIDGGSSNQRKGGEDGEDDGGEEELHVESRVFRCEKQRVKKGVLLESNERGDQW